MSLMDLVNVNYKQIFGKIMQSEEAQCMMADFLNHCIINCKETSDTIIQMLSESEAFEEAVNKAVTRVAKKDKMKTDYFNKI